MLLTNEDGETAFELLRLGVCPTPVAVAIGGGGATGGGGTLGGGGSGYVSYSVLPPTPYVKLLASAGGPGEDSFLKYTKYGHSGTDTAGRYQNAGAGTGTLDIKVLSQVGHLPAHLKLIQLGAG